MAVDRHLSLIHGLEKGRLRLRRSAVDLVGQQKISEDRPGLELEGFGLLVIYSHAKNVAGQHVAGELQAVEAAGDRSRQRLRQRGLTDARNVFDKQVPTR